ncbi:hypothetical protein EYF80_052024 [Liparis tanakae]|uniref:Uncharacterized protein n=1 Tax=Liparis tanakae TaxID=230148 RepID=A0A4Z2FAB1_9TELE|nr:hypothetical protein EYF80_052024 [Liparis tanakae]
MSVHVSVTQHAVRRCSVQQALPSGPSFMNSYSAVHQNQRHQNGAPSFGQFAPVRLRSRTYASHESSLSDVAVSPSRAAPNDSVVNLLLRAFPASVPLPCGPVRVLLPLTLKTSHGGRVRCDDRVSGFGRGTTKSPSSRTSWLYMETPSWAEGECADCSALVLGMPIRSGYKS